MFEFKKLFDAYEELTTVERGLLLTERSVAVMKKLRELQIDGVDPVFTFAGFILGSVISDGHINEKEYLMMYPMLVCVFGDDFDFHSVKETFEGKRGIRKTISEYTEKMISILDLLDENIKNDVITLSLSVVAIDGKISLREKNYIRRLCRT